MVLLSLLLVHTRKLHDSVLENESVGYNWGKDASKEINYVATHLSGKKG